MKVNMETGEVSPSTAEDASAGLNAPERITISRDQLKQKLMQMGLWERAEPYVKRLAQSSADNYCLAVKGLCEDFGVDPKDIDLLFLEAREL
jgi:hypothetical protein